MSHTAEIRVRVKITNIYALKEAIKAAFRAILHQNVEVREGGYVIDYSGRKTKVDLVVPFKGPVKARNIGFKIENGELKMVYESMMIPYTKAEQLLNAVIDAYTAYIAMQALKNMGYNVKVDYRNESFEIVAESVI